jgi:hypothetical protein
MNPDQLGPRLRLQYVFKETHVPTAPKMQDIRQVLVTVVAPAIRELEAKGLLDGFHYITHADIDIRLSCNDWPAKESAIQQVLEQYSIASNLVDWKGLSPDEYGGELGVILCYNNLEFNSRLCLPLLESIHEAAQQDNPLRDQLDRLSPHQWVHYLANQTGYGNMEQIAFELDDVFRWLETVLARSGDVANVKPVISHLLDRLSNKIGRFRREQLGET